jgi:hypothetical protein
MPADLDRDETPVPDFPTDGFDVDAPKLGDFFRK